MTVQDTEPRLSTGTQSKKVTLYEVLEKAPSTDLNNDGKQTIADISIFMLNIVGNNARYDFNLDGSVDLRDLTILLEY